MCYGIVYVQNTRHVLLTLHSSHLTTYCEIFRHFRITLQPTHSANIDSHRMNERRVVQTEGCVVAHVERAINDDIWVVLDIFWQFDRPWKSICNASIAHYPSEFQFIIFISWFDYVHIDFIIFVALCCCVSVCVCHT